MTEVRRYVFDVVTKRWYDDAENFDPEMNPERLDTIYFGRTTAIAIIPGNSPPTEDLSDDVEELLPDRSGMRSPPPGIRIPGAIPVDRFFNVLRHRNDNAQNIQNNERLT